MLNKTKSFQWFLLLIRPTCSLTNQGLTSSRGCGCCVDCIRWLSCRIADVFKNNFDQTIVKMKKKNHIIVIVMMWGRPEFINDRNLKRRFKGFWEDSAVRSSKNFARRIPMPGIEPGPWRWKRQILIDEFHVDILRAFLDVCKIFFQWKCIIVRIECSKDYVGETRIYQQQKSGT